MEFDLAGRGVELFLEEGLGEAAPEVDEFVGRELSEQFGEDIREGGRGEERLREEQIGLVRLRDPLEQYLSQAKHLVVVEQSEQEVVDEVLVEDHLQVLLEGVVEHWLDAAQLLLELAVVHLLQLADYRHLQVLARHAHLLRQTVHKSIS